MGWGGRLQIGGAFFRGVYYKLDRLKRHLLDKRRSFEGASIRSFTVTRFVCKWHTSI